MPSAKKKVKAPSRAIKDPMKPKPKSSSQEIRDQARILLLPNSSVESDSCRIVSYVRAAKSYGGDWWGWAEIARKGKGPLLLLLIGDATGHGAPAALVAGTVRGALSVIHSWANKDPAIASDPREVLRLLNRVVCDAAHGSIVMTLCVVVFDPALNVIRVANAGHNFPYVLSPGPDGTVQLKSLGEGGVPLGHSPETEYADLDTHSWVKGSKIFLYTDGLTECFQDDTNLFDRRRLQKVLRTRGNLDAKDLMDQLLFEREYLVKGIPQGDDVTVVVAEIKE